MLHNAFLVHDDIEDGSDSRRGVATMHRRAGIPIAVNTGDSMNALAMRLFRKTGERLGPAVAMRIFDEVDHLVVETLEGQAMELGWVRDNDLTVGADDYLRLVLKKTAWYSFIHPMRIGALVANGDDRNLDRFDRFGYLLGLAFQITDDVLNLNGRRCAIRQGDRRRSLGGQTDPSAHACAWPRRAARTARGSAVFWRGRASAACRARCCGCTISSRAAAASSGRSRRQPHLQKPRRASSTARHSRACLQVPTSTGFALAWTTLYAGTSNGEVRVTDDCRFKYRQRGAAMPAVREWLTSLGLSEYADRFAEHRIDLSILPDLTDQDLKELGVVLAIAARLLRAIAELAEAASATPQLAPALEPSRGTKPNAAKSR